MQVGTFTLNFIRQGQRNRNVFISECSENQIAQW
jgi:hypothetical protein